MTTRQTSPLLNLSGDIGNTMDGFVSAEPNKVISIGKNVPNKLTLVIRQAHKETDWLELKHAETLEMHHDTNSYVEPGAIQQLITFAKHIPAAAFDHIRTINLTYTLTTGTAIPHINGTRDLPFALSNLHYDITGIPETIPARIELANFCRAHPSLQVRHIIPDFFIGSMHDDARTAAILFLIQGIYYTQLLRSQAPPDWFYNVNGLAAPLIEIVYEAGLRHARQVGRAKLELEHWTDAQKLMTAPNLKFYPAFTTFDGVRFREQILETAESSALGMDIVDELVARNLLDGCVEMGRKFVEDGI